MEMAAPGISPAWTVNGWSAIWNVSARPEFASPSIVAIRESRSTTRFRPSGSKIETSVLSLSIVPR
jgi:hypothetical protein